MSADKILDFWFRTLSEKDWFSQNKEVDSTIMHRFGDLHEQALRGELSHWRHDLKGRLAEIVVLDQFSRNLYRGNAKAFAADTTALVLSQEAIKLDLSSLTLIERSFVYLPFMHSESLVIHRQAIDLYSEPGLEKNLAFEHAHMEIIERFGRYPHRNAILGRTSTPQENAYLADGGESFA